MSSTLIIPESFPNIPEVVKKIQALFRSSKFDNAQLVAVLEEDPLLCANILKLVNSPYYALKRKVTSIEQAVALLGRIVIRGVVMATVLKKSFPLNLSPYKMTVDSFDKISTLRVFFLKEWLKGGEYDIQNLLSIALLMETGIVIISHTIVQNNLQDKFLSLQNEHSILESEKILFNMNSYQAAAILYGKWEFEEEFIAVLTDVKTPKNTEENFLYVLSIIIGVDGILTEETIERSLKIVKERNLEEKNFLKAIELTKREFF